MIPTDAVWLSAEQFRQICNIISELKIRDGFRAWDTLRVVEAQQSLSTAATMLQSMDAVAAEHAAEKQRAIDSERALYDERNAIILLLAKMAEAIGLTFEVNVSPHADGSLVTVTIELPTGSVEWYFYESTPGTKHGEEKQELLSRIRSVSVEQLRAVQHPLT